MLDRSLRAPRARRSVLAATIAVLSALTLAASSAVAAPVIRSLGDLNAGSANGSPSNFTKLGNKVIFAARDETKGMELWRTDGTAAGTKIVKDINTSGDSWPNGFTVFNGYAYFTADNGGGEEMWRTDGTSAGTKKLKDINGDPNTGSTDDVPTRVGNLLYFYANDGVHGYELWRSNGTATGTKMIKDVNPGSGDSDRCCLKQLGNIVLFQAYDPDHGFELWRTDGTQNGTTFVKDVTPGPGDSFPLDRGVLAGDRYFFCSHPDLTLWVTDGTTAGTQPVKDFDYCVNLVSYGSDVLLTASEPGASNVELFRSNGTAGGTAMVDEINASGHSYPNPLLSEPINGVMFYAADDGTDGRELWVYNGSTVSQVEDINPLGGSDPGNHGNRPVRLGNRIFFDADDGSNGLEPFISDGTAAGTFMLKDIYAGSGSSEPYEGAVLNGKLYFGAASSDRGVEMWQTNGTAIGTKRVTDINPGNGHAYPGSFRVIGGNIYFTADDGSHGREPYRVTP